MKKRERITKKKKGRYIGRVRVKDYKAVQWPGCGKREREGKQCRTLEYD